MASRWEYLTGEMGSYCAALTADEVEALLDHLVRGHGLDVILARDFEAQRLRKASEDQGKSS